MRRVYLGADTLAVELAAAIVRHVRVCAGVAGQAIIDVVVAAAA